MHSLIVRSLLLLAVFIARDGFAASASFVREDRSTQGNWINAYGVPNFIAPGLGATNLGAARVTAEGAAYVEWAAQTHLPGALIKPLAPGEEDLTALDRHAAAWTAPDRFSILVERPNTSRRLAIYCLDEEGGGRVQSISLVDTNTGAVLLDTRTGQPCTVTVSGFTNGVYLVWDFLGSVRVDITRVAGPGAVVSAVFINNPLAANPNPPTLDQESVWVAPNLFFSSLGIAANEGDSFALGARTVGEPPLTFRWYRDGVVVPGEMSPTLTFAQVTADRAGDYTLVVSNAQGTATSRVFAVNVYNPWSHDPAYGYLYNNRNGWYGNKTFGWLWFFEPWAWSSRLQGWVATVGDSTMLWSPQFRWVRVSGNEDGMMETSTLGWVYVAENGWVWNERFGWTWAVGDGVWFWSAEMGWLGVTPEGAMWSVEQNRFI